MADPEIIKIIIRFVKALTARGIKVEKTVLYGSHASGHSHENSDVDIAVVSPDFGKDKFGERKLLLQIAWRIDPRLEPLPVSAEAFQNDTWVPLIHEIRQKGITVLDYE